MKESDLENILAKYPELIEVGIRLVDRQRTVYGRRMDLLFEDINRRKLIVELKAGPILDKHIGQIMSYEGGVLSEHEPDTRIMLVGTRVPPNIRRALDHHGIAWKEIDIPQLRAFLIDRKDHSLLMLIESDEGGNEPPAARQKTESSPADIHVAPQLVQTIIEQVLRPMSDDISVERRKRYSSYFIGGRRFLHFYDRKPTRIQLHFDKSYLESIHRDFKMEFLEIKFSVNETEEDFVVKIRSSDNLDYLAKHLAMVYGL